jgi:hypothetical protein
MIHLMELRKRSEVHAVFGDEVFSIGYDTSRKIWIGENANECSCSSSSSRVLAR